jgi:hypothetical protein
MAELSDYTQEQIDAEMAKIRAMTPYEMGRLWRYAPSGHPYFDHRLPFGEVFQARFKELGGWTPSLSKEVGWDG